MTVKDFVEKYNLMNKNEAAMEQFMNAIIPDERAYVSYAKKISVCQSIIDATYYVYDIDPDGNKTNQRLHVNSAATYMLYCLNIVNLYTNIEVDFDDAINEFDAINRNGSIDVIMNGISERELKEFQLILNMIEDDTMQNEYEIHAFISNQVERFGNLTGVAVSPLLEELTKQISLMDDKKLDKLMNKVKEFIPKNK